MVREMAGTGVIKGERVLAAFRAVRRDQFLRGVRPEKVFSPHEAIPTQFDKSGNPTSSSSAPDIMAIMIEQVGLGRGERVMEIGAGTGYNAAVLSGVVGDEGRVVTLEVDPLLALAARDNLRSARRPRVGVVAADGWLGMPGGAQWDVIEVTAAVQDLSPRWVEQLREGGRLVAPLALGAGPQASVALVKRGEDLASVSAQRCGFMMLRGPHAGQGDLVSIPGWVLSSSRRLTAVDLSTLRELMTVAPEREAAPALPEGWLTRLAFEEPGAIRFSAPGDWGRRLGGVFDREGPGLALVGGRSLLTWGSRAPADRLRAAIASARPLDIARCRLTAVPTGSERPRPRGPALRRDNYTFVVADD